MLGLFLLIGGVAGLAYNLGAASAVAPAASMPPLAAPVAAPLFLGGFFFFGFLFKLLLILLLVRLAFGFFGGGWRGRWGGWDNRRRWDDHRQYAEPDAAERFEEWHRRAHDSTNRPTTF
jgi:hypothetical protein